MKRFFLPYLLVFLVACSKGSSKDKDYDAPALTLNTPLNNQVYTPGQNIMIAGQASDNKYINQIHIVISNLATGTEYLHIHIHPNSSAFNFTQPYTAQGGITYKIDVIVDDASSNSTAKTVEVSCN
jgi:chitodextrinase